MDESGIDMGFDLAALTDIDTNDHQHGFGDDDFEQALSLLSTTTKDFMYYELKSRAPDTGRVRQKFLNDFENSIDRF
ncbi:microphthalmia-associated transcription factor isoform X4 [Vespula squamosa]|uniref:Microphthalmia-associated transcription factor isoform X4 n=1 Tax=Vespula squamosa TaxID=30214 RepID=A0ABD2C1R6_VESSQ